jgi:hypothetical protein
MQSVRALFSVVLALTLVVGTSQSSVLSSESMQGELPGSHMVMHVMGAHSTMPGTCHKCINKAPCCVVCVGTQAILPASKVIRVTTKQVVVLFTEPEFKSCISRPSPPPPKLGDLT